MSTTRMKRGSRYRRVSRLLPTVFAVIGLVVGAALLWGQQLPLMDRGPSIGLYAAAICLVTAAVIYPVERTRINQTPEMAWRHDYPATRWNLDVIILTAAHALMAMLLCLGAFGLFQQGFVDLTLDPVAGALVIMSATFVAGILVQHSASDGGCVHYTSVLIATLATGCIGAMLIARDATWWQRDFSQLGGMGSLGALILNITLVISGVAAIFLADYLAPVIRRHRDRFGSRAPWVLRLMLAIVGVLMVIIGVIPVSVSRPVHVFFAMAMALTLVVMMAITPILFLGLDRGFVWATGGAVGVVVIAVLMSRVVGYFSWTAVEVIAATVIFSWLAVFVRRIAELDESPAEPAAEHDERLDGGAAATESTTSDQPSQIAQPEPESKPGPAPKLAPKLKSASEPNQVSGAQQVSEPR